jgi:hypothetical protein
MLPLLVMAGPVPASTTFAEGRVLVVHTWMPGTKYGHDVAGFYCCAFIRDTE